MKQTLSVVISAYNEAAKIHDCLESVHTLADEIVLIDNASTDDTVKIAKKFSPKIFTRENNAMLNINKNFGFSKATSEWILLLDADERLSVGAACEIEQLLENTPEADGYFFPRKNIIFGKWIEHTGWYPDYQLRLFKKGTAKFAEKHVHEMVTIQGHTANLQSPIVHYNYESITQFFEKMIRIYAPNEADNLLAKGYEFHWYDVIRFPLKEFLRRYFANQGYKDGLHGLVLSGLMASYHLAVFCYLWEKRNFEGKNLQLSDVAEEMKRSQKEINYWVINEEIRQTENPLKKAMLKVTKRM